MSSYQSELAWADANCASVGKPLFDLSILPVSWADTGTPHRSNPLLKIIRAASATGATLDSVMNGGGNDWLKTYVESVLPAMMFPIVFAIIASICCGAPLWISRCCAHRCCKHSDQPYGRRSRMGMGACCVLSGVVVIVFLAIGAVAGAAAVPAVKETLCGVDSFFRNTTSFLGGVESHVGTLNRLALQANQNVSAMNAELTCLSATFTTGSVFTSCKAVTAASGAASSVDSRVSQASGGQSASQLSAEWASVVSQLAATQQELCVTIPAYEPGVASAQTAISDLKPQLDSTISGLSSVMTSLADQTRNFENAHTDYIRAQKDVWTALSDGSQYSGGVPFIPHMALVVLGLLGVLCMLRKPTEACCSVNGTGVQVTGFGWVLYSAYAPLLFIVGGLLIFSAFFMSDAGHLVLEIPRDPYTTLGQGVCDQHTISFGGGTSVSPCALVAGCFASPAVSLWTTIAPSLTFNLTDIATQAEAAIDASGFANGPPFNVSALRHAADESSALVAQLSGVSASGTFGIPPSHPQHDPIDVDLAALVANLTAASNAVSSGTDLDCADAVTVAVPELTALIDEVLAEASTPAMEATFACGFFAANLDGVIQPSLQGTVRDATGAVALCLVVAGAFALIVVVTLTRLQVMFGDVGIEPGVPSCCRCCCCYAPGANVHASRLAMYANEFSPGRGLTEFTEYPRAPPSAPQHGPSVEKIPVVQGEALGGGGGNLYPSVGGPPPYATALSVHDSTEQVYAERF